MADHTESESRKLLGRLRDALAEDSAGQARLDHITHLIADSTKSEVCSIYLFRAAETRELVATEGLKPDAGHKTPLRRRDGLGGRAALEVARALAGFVLLIGAEIVEAAKSRFGSLSLVAGHAAQLAPHLVAEGHIRRRRIHIHVPNSLLPIASVSHAKHQFRHDVALNFVGAAVDAGGPVIQIARGDRHFITFAEIGRAHG